MFQICDADLYILHVDASYIWNLYPVKAGMQRLHKMGQIFWFLGKCHLETIIELIFKKIINKINIHDITGDSGYAQRPWMMTTIFNAHPGSPE